MSSPAGSEGRIVVIGDRHTLPLFRAAGLAVAEAYSSSEAVEVMRREAHGTGLFIVLKHIVDDEEALRREAEKLGVQLLVLPTKWAPPKPLRVEELIARALGVG